MAEIVVDGQHGGGQVLRTALTMSMCTGRPVTVKNIRAERAKPGLLRQHLAALRAAQAVSGAQIAGDELGSMQVAFAPLSIRAGDYTFRVGSAGSTTLVMQTVLPALALADQPSSVRVEGGTHNGMAPSVDFFERAFAPLIARSGLKVASRLDRHGFYPNGGGSWAAVIQPRVDCAPLELRGRGALVARKAVAKFSQLQAHVVERELTRVAKKLRMSDAELQAQEVDSPGPGNIVSVRMEYEAVTEVFEAVGALGVSAERVAGRAIADTKRYQRGTYPVGPYLADQLLVPMTLGGGGEFLTGPLSTHALTNMRVIEQMLERPTFEVCEHEDGQGRVCTLVKIPEGLALTRQP